MSSEGEQPLKRVVAHADSASNAGVDRLGTTRRVDARAMPSLLDRELRAPEADAFGHRHLAEALRDLIESADNHPPFSIGLLGSWGMGKSTIKEFYLGGLQADEARDGRRIRRRDRIRTITFNAWRFGGENVKRALLRHVYRALGGNESHLADALFNQITRSALEARSWPDILRDAWGRFGWGLAIIIVFFVAIGGITWLLARFLGLPDPLGLMLPVLIGAGALLAKPFLDPRWLIVPRYAAFTRVELPHASAEQYEGLLIDQLSSYKHGAGRRCERLVIFVDDLDRLSAEEMVSGLDAIRTFMDLTADDLPEGLGIVFVVSCDEERVARALAERGRSGDLPGAVFSRTDARRFLDRIFQFRLEIPPLPRQDMRGFARDALRRYAPQIVGELERRDGAFDSVVDRLIHVGVQSPRNVVQLLNAFSDSWWLAEKREHEGAGTDRPGGLREGAVTGHPEALAALCALRVDFPDFYGQLEREPRLIEWLTNVFVRGQPLEEQPERVKEALREYCYADEHDLAPQHRPLRRYITSLEGLHWPPSLQPLLLLSQDPVTRRYGDQASRVFEALVSGDSQGVLTELGRDKDSRALIREDVRLLRDLEDELHGDTPVRRNNAAAVVAAIAPRLPPADAHLLLTPLARRLAESQELRWRVGLPKIRSVLPPVPASDRRAVAACLIDDLLLVDGEVISRLESGGEPSLQEALEMAREAASLALSVRRDDGLDDRHERKLLDWLLTRRVAVRGREDHLSIRQLEMWMSEYEWALVSALSAQYVRLLAGLIEADQTDELVVEDVIRRSRQVFDQLRAGGEETRAELWDLLARYVSAKLPAAVSLAWQFIIDLVEQPPASALTTFVQRLAERLPKDIQDADWELPDWRDAAAGLLRILNARPGDIGPDAHRPLVALAQDWSGDDKTGDLAVHLLAALQAIDSDQADDVLTDWCGRVLSDLAAPCLHWLAANFAERPNDAQRADLLKGLDEIHTRDNITQDEAQRYSEFVSRLPQPAFASGPLQTHFQRLLSQVTQRHSNPNGYLDRVFPALPPLLQHIQPESIGSMLHGLFTQTRGNNLTLFGWLHGQMAGFWPQPSSELTPYNPEQLFQEAVATVTQHANDELAVGVLVSVRDMAQRGVAGQDKIPEVLKAACAMWPHFPAEAFATLVAFHIPPDETQVAALMEGIDPADAQAVDRLARVWTHIAQHLGDEQGAGVAKQLLAAPPQGIREEPDLGMLLWFDALGERKSSVFGAALLDLSINDEQRKRVWLQVHRAAPELGLAFFLGLLPQLLAHDSPETAQSVLDAEGAVSGLAASAEERYDLSRTLLQALAMAPTTEIKNRLAGWLQRVGGTGSLRELEQIPDLSWEDVELIDRFIRNSRYVKRWRERHAQGSER